MLWLTSLPTADWILNKQIQVAEFSRVSTQAGRRSKRAHTHTHTQGPRAPRQPVLFLAAALEGLGGGLAKGAACRTSRQRERETCGKKNEGEVKVRGGWQLRGRENRNLCVYCSGMKIRNSSGQKKPGLLNVAALLIFLVVSSEWLGAGCCQSVSQSGQLGCQAVFVWVYINPL